MSKTFSEMETFLRLLSALYNDDKIVGKSSDKFVHYTSLSAFKAMISDYSERGKRYVKLFPSHCRYLNDSREYIEGSDVVKKNKKVQERIASEIDNGDDVLPFDDEIYTTSFCGRSDLLSQWKYYGKDGGIAIDFDFVHENQNRCKFNWFENSKDATVGKDAEDIVCLRDGYSFLSRPLKVFYADYEGRFKKFMQVTTKRSDVSPLTMASLFIPLCKHETFAEEIESRLIFSPISDKEKKLTTEIKYWAKEDKIVPQFECKVFYRDDGDELQKPIPLNNVMIGPGQNQTLVFNSVIHMLQKEKSNLRFIYPNPTKIESIMSDALSDRVKQINGSKAPIKDRLLNVTYKDGKKNMNYVTFVTDVGITVQMSSTPFRP